MSLFLHQLRGEQRLYWRSRELAFFTFLFPVVLFVLLGSVYGSDRIKSEHNVKSSAYLLAGVLGYGVASTAFAGLAIVIVLRRENGILKRLRATPLPPAVYLAGVIASTVLVFAVEAAALIVLGRVMFDVPFPDHWASVIVSLLLGALVVRGAGDRALGRDPLRRGLVGRGERDLPADGVPRRRVLVAACLPAFPGGDRGDPAAHVLHPADARRRAPPRDDLVELGIGRCRRRMGDRRRHPRDADVSLVTTGGLGVVRRWAE